MAVVTRTTKALQCDNPTCDVEFDVSEGEWPDWFIGTAGTMSDDPDSWHACSEDCIEGAVKYVLELAP
jgi:hypothetical protein